MDFDKILKFEMPRYNQLPGIDLYIDQVLAYIESVLAPLEIETNDRILTASMVNNYVKKGIVPPTVKKKYSKQHVAYLLIVCFCKQLYTMDEIYDMITIQSTSFDLETSYNYMCTELENVLKCTFTNQPMPQDTSRTKAIQRHFVRSTLIAFSNKLYTKRILRVYKENDLNPPVELIDKLNVE